MPTDPSLSSASHPINFKFFALRYLDDWFQYDKEFATNLSPGQSKGERLRCIQDAAKYYRISRNFKTLPNEDRLDSALASLDATCQQMTEANVDSMVSKLASDFKYAYGKRAISAASKLLWLRYRWPVVIFDSRAFQCIKKSCKGKLDQNYADYRLEWLTQFEGNEQNIRTACCTLVSVKEFSLARDTPDEDLTKLVGNLWFQHRVFDKYLWWKADGDDNSECAESPGSSSEDIYRPLR